MVEVIREVAAIRAGIRKVRACHQFVRWAFFALLAVCGTLIASRFLRIPSEISLAFLAVPVVVGVGSWWKSFSLRDCALQIDRRFRLDERISTAMEGGGVFERLLVEDATRALKSVPAERFRWPREMLLTVLAGLAALILWALPSPEGVSESSPALRSVSREERQKLLERAFRAKGLEGDSEAIALLLDRATPEAVREALVRLRDLEEKASALAASSTLSHSEREALGEIAAGAAGAATSLARALEAEGELPKDWNPAPPSVVKKMGIQGGSHPGTRPSEAVIHGVAEAGASEIQAREAVRRSLERRDWPPDYDAPLRRYFSE